MSRAKFNLKDVYWDHGDRTSMNPRIGARDVVASALLPGDRIVRPSTAVPATVTSVDRVDGVVVVTTVGGEPIILTRGSRVTLRV